MKAKRILSLKRIASRLFPLKGRGKNSQPVQSESDNIKTIEEDTVELQTEKFYHYSVQISLKHRGSSIILPIGLGYFSRHECCLDKKISFDFMKMVEELEKSKNKNNRKSAKICRKIAKEHPRTLAAKIYQVISFKDQNTFIIRPIMPRKHHKKTHPLKQFLLSL